MPANVNDLLQRFIENEKKSKLWTLISVLIFIGLAGTTILFAFKFKQTSLLLTNALVKADSLNIANETIASSLENASKTADDLRRQYDSLLAKNSHIQFVDPKEVDKKKYTVYIQYTATYENESKSILSLLQKNNFNTPGRELMKRSNFASCIKYFNDADKTEAQRMASLINSNIDKFAKAPIRILKNNINVPGGQLEVWLGDNIPLRIGDIIKKYDSKTSN